MGTRAMQEATFLILTGLARLNLAGGRRCD
jgi:hypothetical protein